MTYAVGVCVLDNPFFIDSVYDYRVPADMAADIVKGGFVTVPFGNSNTLRMALVTELREEPPQRELKAVHEICPPTLALDEEMQGLCAFMKERMLCSTGDAVRAMMPASALSRLATVYYATDIIPPTRSDDPEASDLLVYEYLRENGTLRYPQLRRRFGAFLGHALRHLRASGSVVKETVQVDPAAEKLVRVWYSPLPREEISALLEGREVMGHKLTSEKQRCVLRAVLESETPMTTSELKSSAEVGDAPLKTLSAHGFLAWREVRLERNSYADVPFTGQTPITLNEEQTAAVETLDALTLSGEARAALLHGVTGSGKTAVMTVLIDRLLSRSKGVILLLPEIALTPQTVSIFCARYGERVALIHSGLSAGERYDTWCRIREGRADVVIGTRSAVFAPVRNLGAIIIDEEHEHTYKSDQNPKYHARDVARYRCHANGALMLLASATPSVESYKKAKEGVYTLVRLTRRFGGAHLPRVLLADMRGEAGKGTLSPLSELLISELSRRRARDEQAILFLNRRGYNHFISCRACGEAVKCPSCSVSMTYHKKRRAYDAHEMICHWCGARHPVPTECPTCHSPHLQRMGFGTQRVEEELGTLFPDARVLRMDTDTTSTRFSYDTMLSEFREKRADILLGTQMVTKGHDFPAVTLVGVLLADMSLFLEDYRAAERTFSMLTQVIGRAGRGEREGVAVIQTSNPDHEVIRLACAQDYEGFYEREIRLRRLLTFPPFCDIALLTVTGTIEAELFRYVDFLMRIYGELEKKYSDVQLIRFGPFEAPVYRVDNKYRVRLVLKCKLNRRTLAMLSELICTFGKKAGQNITLSADLNPSTL
ncbi:MAG: primosomal protein N' [Ruminococcaceae bacterium]|nr:primosomal protein N' [Oscillospiraceae bacterium]